MDDYDSDAPTLRKLVSELGLTVGRPAPGDETQLDLPPEVSDVLGLVHGKDLGRYPVTGHLGAGGMGEVLRVVDPEIGRELAAKVIRGATDRTRVAKFILEAQVTGQLEHPNIVPMHELGMTGEGQIYFTMKRVEGRTLEALLLESEEGGTSDESGRRLALESGPRRLVPLLQIFLKVCDALAFAHSKGVIHRDLKPENVMVGRFGEVQVMDWGLAKVLGRPDLAADGVKLAVGEGQLAEMARGGKGAQPLVTLDGTVCGTPQYMPPEQALGEIHKLDARSEVYALGAMLYRMLAGRPPYEGDSAASILYQLAHGPPLPPSQAAPERGIPWDLEIAVIKAMKRRRANRYQSVLELRRDLEAWIEGRLVQAADYTAWQALKKWAARNKAAVTAAAGILLALVLGLAGIGHQLRQANMERRKAEQKEAEAQRQKKRAEEKEAEAQRQKQQAERNLRSFTQMSDVKLLAEMKGSEEELWPPVPARIPAMEGWLVEARKLAARLVAHRTALDQLKRRAGLDPATAWRRDVLEELVPDLERFGKVTVPDVERRIPLARKRHELSVVQHREAWAKATRAIRAHPRYGGLVLVPQEGLVPLGPDPTSTLWEFAEVSSGRLPQRDDSGKLQLDAGSAIVLVLLPGGVSRMGSTRMQSEGPVHEVRLDPFVIGKHEVTQAQWLRVMGENPSHYSAGKRAGRVQISLTHPVEQVSWDDCRGMLLRIGLVLPSEAQWEYAARGGTRTEWWCGKEATSIGAGQPMAGNVADGSNRQAGGTTQAEKWTDGHAVHAPIGSFRPNPFGLHDVIGNVWEWCRDEYFEEAYKWPVGADGVRRVPSGQKRSRLRSSRGGGWSGPAVYARCAFRFRDAPANRDYALGLRPAGLITK